MRLCEFKIGLALVAVLMAGSAGADGRRDCSDWTATWGAAMQAPLGVPPAVFENQTLRQIVHISLGGESVRVKFSNVLGAVPLTINAATVALQATGASVERGTVRHLAFGGNASITIPPGAVAVTDPVNLRVGDEADLAISLYVADASMATSGLTLSHQTSYVSPAGDFSDERTFAPASTITSWYWLSGVEVKTRRSARTIVAFGDSITEGFASTTDANARWPDVLARRLLARGRNLAVIDEAISGNRVLNDEIGPNAQRRLDTDVLAATGATDVIFLMGINDIGFSQLGGVFPPNVLTTNVSAEEIIQGYQQIIRRVHAQGLRIYGGTLTPFQGAGYADAAGEAKREAVNHFVRTSGAFDGVVDFDKTVRDPANPLQILPAFDSGDHLHPNDAGYDAMGHAVDLRLFPDPRRCEN